MCLSMRWLRLGEEKKKEETTGQNIMVPLLHRAAIINPVNELTLAPSSNCPHDKYLCLLLYADPCAARN